MSDIHYQRRQKILNRLGDGLLVLPTAPLRLRNGDVYHSFRPDSSFYYLTGFEEPDAVLVARRRDRRRHESLLFLRPRDPEREIWDGARLGPARAKRRLGIDDAHPIDEIYTRLEPLLDETERLYYTLGNDDAMDRALFRLFERRAVRSYRGNPAAHPGIVDPRPVIAVERLVKDAHEVEALERAVEATVAGHLHAMATARPGMMEYELQAEIEAAFRRSGSPRNGYESIVASGPNACTLHYVSNDRRMRSGDLVLVDAGAERGLYTADVTRTFPANGRFTDAQRAVYRVVLRAQRAAIRAAVAGRPWNAPHRAAVRETVKGLIELKILRGDRATLIEKEKYRRWFMHGTSHWLGMDVHDAGGYQTHGGKPRPLEPGMVLTIEPGLYFGARDRSVREAFRGIGIRIEDDILVTRKGPRVLTEDVPKEVRDVEAACAR